VVVVVEACQDTELLHDIGSQNSMKEREKIATQQAKCFTGRVLFGCLLAVLRVYFAISQSHLWYACSLLAYKLGHIHDMTDMDHLQLNQTLLDDRLGVVLGSSRECLVAVSGVCRGSLRPLLLAYLLLWHVYTRSVLLLRRLSLVVLWGLSVLQSR